MPANKTEYMQAPKRYKLIDGDFTVKEAQEVLLSLLDSKIKYHRREIFSAEIKAGKKSPKDKSRLEELVKTYDEIKKMLWQAEEKGHTLSILSFIDISFHNNENIQS